MSNETKYAVWKVTDTPDGGEQFAKVSRDYDSPSDCDDIRIILSEMDKSARFKTLTADGMYIGGL